MEVADVGRAFAEHANHRLGLSLVLDRQPDPGSDGQMGADDGVAAPVAVLGAGHVHRAALAAHHAGGLAEHFRHDALGIQAACDGPTVVAVGRQQVVVRPHRLACAGGDGLLADVQVQKAADLAGGVQLGCFLLEPADQRHLPVQLQQLLMR